MTWQLEVSTGRMVDGWDGARTSDEGLSRVLRLTPSERLDGLEGAMHVKYMSSWWAWPS